MSILLTGSTGFVGKNLKEYLEGNFEIVTASLRYPNLLSLEINSQAIVHLSGKAHDLASVSVPEDYYDANFKLTKELYDAFLKSEATKFIFVSSVKAAADSVEDILFEDVICEPKTHYGKSKLMAEQYITSQTLPEGKSYYILRPCMIHGPGNKGNLNLLFNLVRRGIPYPLAEFENERSFLSIENLSFIIEQICMRKDIPSGVYNVADNDALSTNRVVTLLSESLGKKPTLWYIKPALVRAFARIGDKFRLPLNTEKLNKLTENYKVSNDKIVKALGKPLPVSAQAGLLSTANSFKKNNI